MATQKQHDCLNEMAEFSRVWQKYDEQARNKLFAADFTGALVHMKKCYEDMAAALHLTVAEVKARCLKYRDSVTKAVKQYAQDLHKGTCDLPTAAATKLSIFNWLMPFSCHYNASTMEGKNLDQYIESILRGQANCLERHKVDASEVRSALAKVSTYLRDAGKPRTLVLTVQKLDWHLLPTIALDNGVIFRHGYSPMSVFSDESESCEYWESFSLSDLPVTVSSWLSRNIDPTFDWHKAGMVHFSTHVKVHGQPREGKNATVKRSDTMAVALNRCASASREARIAMDKAHSKEERCLRSVCYSIALAGCGTSVKTTDAAAAVDMQTVTVRLLMQDVLEVMRKVLHLESMHDKFMTEHSRVVSYTPSLLRSLQAVRVNSKIYSSQFWNLPKCK